MSMPARVAAGVPTGGQFAATSRTEAETNLTLEETSAAIAHIRSTFETADPQTLTDFAQVHRILNRREAFTQRGTAWHALRIIEQWNLDDADQRRAAEKIFDDGFARNLTATAEEEEYAFDALDAVHDTARAVAARHLIGSVPGWTQASYDRLTLPWAATFGLAHPGDAVRYVTKESVRQQMRESHPEYHAFKADLDRFNEMFTRHDAVIEFEDGSRGVDATKLPAGVLDTYTRLTQFGYANDLIG